MAWHIALIDKLIARDRTATIADYLRLIGKPWVILEPSWPEYRVKEFHKLPRFAPPLAVKLAKEKII